MPTYEYECVDCGSKRDLVCSMAAYGICERVLEHCGKAMRRVISGGQLSFNRSSFEKGPFEHVDTEPRAFRDKVEMKEFCDEAGLRSRYLEDGDIP